MTIEQIIDAQMLAFNNRDIKSMMPLYPDDIKIYNFPDTLAIDGKKECEKMFVTLFENSPNLRAEIIKTIQFDNKVIVQEYIYGRNGSNERTEQVVIFEVTNQKISRMDIMRK
ncbi:nuclear transport factor 2 family protein [Flavobacterium sp. AC]|uniref:Nuclear transport factor 2 family protein n=1 Tax=Flavobacterium azizsancarii TaxID=2961580 RepID=A0ABT4WIF9_9FLAO|nr:nuclear transport factor 2 family protein [Flavobacterium azizsancarii]MDA6072322.1 nuclear transport factor 2 family protein [Flavobacterium azizsancarii]